MIIAKQKLWGNAFNLPNYDFTGAAPTMLKDNSGNWELVFLTGCTITFNRLNTDVDVFLVAGGAKAGDSIGNAANNYAIGGAGGKGGGIVNDTLTLETGVAYPIVIGGSGQDTTAFGKTAVSGAGSNGGAGAYTAAAGNGTDGVLAFNNTGGTLYENGTPIKFGAGGGGGAAKASASSALRAAGSGGATGGGAGGDGSGSNGSDSNADSKNGRPNTGGGGGGGSRNNETGSGGNYPGPGKGGSGIVIIRNHREET